MHYRLQSLFFGDIEVPVVVDADFTNDETGLAVANVQASDF
jgi:hypothetical protein